MRQEELGDILLDGTLKGKNFMIATEIITEAKRRGITDGLRTSNVSRVANILKKRRKFVKIEKVLRGHIGVNHYSLTRLGLSEMKRARRFYGVS